MPNVLENAALVLGPGATSFVWILDFSGFGLGCCNPAQGKAAISTLADHYPERLALIYLGTHAERAPCKCLCAHHVHASTSAQCWASLVEMRLVP